MRYQLNSDRSAAFLTKKMRQAAIILGWPVAG